MGSVWASSSSVQSDRTCNSFWAVGVSGSSREMTFSSNFRNFLAASDSEGISSTSVFRVRGFSVTCLDLADVALLGAGARPLLRLLEFGRLQEFWMGPFSALWVLALFFSVAHGLPPYGV